MDINKIKDCFKDYLDTPIWVLWKLIQRDNGSFSKMPISVNKSEYGSYKYAESNNPDTWSTFYEVEKVFNENSNEYQGIGIMLDPQFGLVFIDLDHCIDDSNKPNTFCEDFLKSMIDSNLNTYIEKSQSGTGIHTFVIGSFNKDLYKCKNPEGTIEVYSNGRFCALTGDTISSLPPANGQEWFEGFCEKYLKREKKARSKASNNKIIPLNQASISDNVVCTLPEAKNISYGSKYVFNSLKANEEFVELFKGNWMPYFSSQSEADLKFCGLVARKSLGNPKIVDELFRASKLYRNKWDEVHYENGETYGEHTISEAIDTSKFIDEAPFYLAEARYDLDYVAICKEKLNEIDPYRNPIYSIATQTSFAKLFCECFKDYMVFDRIENTFKVFDGRIWNSKNKSEEILSVIFVDELLCYTNSIKKERDSDKFISMCNKMQGHTYRKHLLEDAKVFIPAHVDFFSEDHYLGMHNCIFDLNSLKPLPFSNELHVQKMSGTSFNPYSTSKVFENFLKEIFDNDFELMDFIKQIFGLCLINNNFENKFFIFLGKSTRNGKTTLLNTMLNMLGDYSRSFNSEIIEKNKQNANSPSPSMSRLKDCRLAVINEPDRNMKLDTSKIKNLTGQSRLTTRDLYSNDSYEFVSNATCILDTNYEPLVNDETIFLSNRICVIPFNVHIPEEKQDKYLREKLCKADVLSEVFNMALEGLRIIKSNNHKLKIPEAVIDATQSYAYNSDEIESFLSDCFVPCPEGKISASEMWQVYNEWCKYARPVCQLTKGAFRSELFEHKGVCVEGRSGHEYIHGFKRKHSSLCVC